nr:hypothetical protein [Cellulomonas fimi]
MLSEDRYARSAKSSEDHSEFEDDILSRARPRIGWRILTMANVVGSQEDAREPNIPAVTQVMLELLDNGVTGRREVGEKDDVKAKLEQHQFDGVPRSLIMAIDDEHQFTWAGRRTYGASSDARRRWDRSQPTCLPRFELLPKRGLCSSDNHGAARVEVDRLTSRDPQLTGMIDLAFGVRKAPLY